MNGPDAGQLREQYDRRKERASKVRNVIGLLILLTAFGWSVVHVTYEALRVGIGGKTLEGTVVIRFAHWQLEGDTVKAIDEACRKFERVYPEFYTWLQRKQGKPADQIEPIKVRVEQIEVPERAYEQWTKTQLIGRMAPDLIELRTWKWRDLMARYFVPVTEIIDRPNPFNEYFGEDDLAGKPWRETYIDGMQGGWIDVLQDNYGMPMSVFTIRIYVNKDLIRRIAGDDREPETLGKFLALCRKIGRYRTPGGRRVVPIAGADYIANIFRGSYWNMCTWPLIDAVDTNCDGGAGNDERLLALWPGGAIDLATDRHVRSAYRIVYDITRHFDEGFMASKRDDAVLLFCQAQAAMIATGSWEAGTLKREVGGRFAIDVWDFPVAGENERYGDTIRYRKSEADTRAGFNMGLTKTSRHKDVAVDFMRFLTSRTINEEINGRFRWFPSTVGARKDEVLEKFTPKMEGVSGGLTVHFARNTQLDYEQGFQGFLSRPEPTREDYKAFLAAYRDLGRERLKTKYDPKKDEEVRNALVAERFLAGHADNVADYRYEVYLAQWRDAHYQVTVAEYAKQFRADALGDFEKALENDYSAITGSEPQLARVRARAVLEGFTPRVRRNLVSLIFGQAKRATARARDQAAYDAVKAGLSARGGGEGGGG